MKNILYVIAMEKEALDIVEKLNLTKVENLKNLEIYEKDSIRLLITGIGKQRVAISLTTYLENNKKPDRIINVGYAGSVSAKIGSWACVTNSYNYEWNIPGEEKYEILGFEEKKLTVIENEELLKLPCYSAESFVTKTDIIENSLFDMELHSVYLICSIYDIELVGLKKVSDNLSLKDYYENIDMKDIMELKSCLRFV